MTHNAPMSHPAATGTTDYIVVVSTEDDFHASYHHFAEKVNRKLRAGYRLHGQPFNIKQTLCQAMVRPAGAAETGEDTTVFLQNTSGYHS